MEQLEASQGPGLNELEASMAGRLDVLMDQWNEKILKVTEQHKTSNKSFSEHFD